VRLTKRAIDAAEPGERGRILWDDELRGFGLRLYPPSPRYPAGARVFVLRYRTEAGTPRQQTLGHYGVLTPDQARRIAAETLARVRAGGDPVTERRDARSAPTFAELADRYEREHLPKLKPAWAVEAKRIIKADLRTKFGPRRLREITPGEIARWHAARSAAPYAANRALAVLRAMFERAAEWGLREDGPNPAARVKRFPEKARETYLGTDELERLGKALEELATEKDGRRHRPVAAIKLLALTGARKREVLRLRWEHVDLERGIAWLADSKTGPRPLRLEVPALALLAELPREGDWVFPSPRKPDAPIENVRGTMAEALKRAKLEKVRVHDLRHTKASAAAAMGFSLPMIGALLGHRRASTTERYAHLAADPVREAEGRVQARIDAALRGKPKAPVVPLREAE